MAQAGTSSRSCGARNGTLCSRATRSMRCFAGSPPRSMASIRRSARETAATISFTSLTKTLKCTTLSRICRIGDIDGLKRGGHDLRKLFAAFELARATKDKPTVILAKTKKGFGMGGAGESRMTSHQAKKLDIDALIAFRDRFALPLTDEQTAALEFYKPAENSAELRYLRARRDALGGYLPARRRGALKV